MPVATTIAGLLDATRAHVGFALEHGGEQVLANVAHVGDLARRYEAEGGLSFRGFIDELREQAESGEAGEAPILEEGSDGVRLMTVHKSKGLEFPIVILADMTARLRSSVASRTIDAERRVCAIRLAGCAPADLLEHQDEELLRDEAEGMRVAYVAATRARDLLVIPAVGDEERTGWIEPLNGAIYPPMEMRRQQLQAPGCVEFKSKDSVLVRPGGSAGTSTVSPGLHVRKPGSSDPLLHPPPGAGEEEWGRLFRRLVGSTRAKARRRGAARHSPAGADREGRRAGYRRIGSCRIQFLARAAPTGHRRGQSELRCQCEP